MIPSGYRRCDSSHASRTLLAQSLQRVISVRTFIVINNRIHYLRDAIFVQGTTHIPSTLYIFPRWAFSEKPDDWLAFFDFHITHKTGGSSSGGLFLNFQDIPFG